MRIFVVLYFDLKNIFRNKKQYNINLEHDNFNLNIILVNFRVTLVLILLQRCLKIGPKSNLDKTKANYEIDSNFH